ncbi:DISEASE RESISTANCE PROTEIN RP [Salix viminalis]|uniref:DISEASE RESISTANCE PROTEIN RP n=1 Tax=Salix viminalis TaxID=40686 RepID=A0A9Q0NLL4_SALVM|nr:DISEASE RESISTANCE PROTEIN RP [Salix viminalis]
MMGTDHRIDIETLSDDACRSIFNRVAFHERSKDERERLTYIGNKIASKCKGLPLAAKVLGGLMQSKRTRKEWEDVLSSELWRLDEVDKDQVEKKLFLPLLLSYYDLPSVVRRCFLYCAMFPKDYKMSKDELVRMWMAQGYLKETGSRDMEVVGEQVLTPAEIDDYLAEGIDIVFFGSSGVLPCIDTNRDTCVLLSKFV